MKKITSDDYINVYENFRVSAGPGAGKTHWLVNHINNVLQNSEMLVGTKKIACITYTNIGVDTIQKRLGDNTSVEVMTIHSFLYKNVVKPYAQFCSDEYSVNAKRLDGHDEAKMHKATAKKWLENHTKVKSLKHPFTLNQIVKLNHNLMALCNWLVSMRATITDDGQISFECNNQKAIYYYSEGNKKKRTQINSQTLNNLKGELIDYKRLLWSKGIIDHEDVLYISFRLIQDNPFILSILRSKYPYYFIDEYQDTNPIQSYILKLIASDSVFIGVIGDEAQSIYGFQGAKAKLFKENIAETVSDYVIEDNRRSTSKIVDCLNLLRNDITQKSLRDVNGEIPIILVGDKKSALVNVQDEFGEHNVQTLSRDNIMSNIMKRAEDDSSYDKDVVEMIYSIDKPNKSNGYRSLNLMQCIRSVELAKQNKFKDSIKEMRKVFQGIECIEEKNIKAINAIKLLLDQYDSYEKCKLISFVNIVKQNVCSDISNLRSGKPKTFYEETDYRKVAICVNITEDISLSKTIHKAKGDEYKNVLIVFKNESDVDFLIKTDLPNKEEHRIYYVALSRAKDNLVISVPKLSKSRRISLGSNFVIRDV